MCLCRQTISRIYTIFNTVHAMSDMNNIYQFQDIWRIFTRVRARTGRRTDGQTGRQTNRMHKHFWTLLESVKKQKQKFLGIYIGNICASMFHDMLSMKDFELSLIKGLRFQRLMSFSTSCILVVHFFWAISSFVTSQKFSIGFISGYLAVQSNSSMLFTLKIQ